MVSIISRRDLLKERPPKLIEIVVLEEQRLKSLLVIRQHIPLGPRGDDHPRIEAAQRKLADCDARLAKYRAALDAGADPAIVTGWIAEVQGDRMRAEREIGMAQTPARFTKQQVRALVEGLGDMAATLAEADRSSRRSSTRNSESA